MAWLGDRLDVQVQKLTAVQARATSAIGSDRSGLITVTMDAQGAVSDVVVDASWRRTMGPQGLGAAVCEAVDEAARARLAGWGGAFTEEAADSDPPPRPTAPEADRLASEVGWMVGGSSQSEGVAALRALIALLEQVERDVDEVSAMVTDLPRVTHTVTTRSGRVRVVVAGTGVVRQVSYQGEWLRSAVPSVISRETVKALQLAQQVVAEKSPQGLLTSGAVGTLMAFAQEPLQAAGRVGL